MASAASQRGRIIEEEELRRWMAGRDNPDVQSYVAKELQEGGGKVGLSAEAMKFVAKNETYEQRMRSLTGFRLKPEPAAIAGLRNTSLPEGYVYIGAAETKTPRISVRSRNAGLTSTPGRTTYTPIVLPRDVFTGSAAAPAAAQEEKKPLEPGADLMAAREAYDRANQYQRDSGSKAFSPDLSLTGGALLNDIYRSGAEGVDKFENKTVQRFTAGANLAGQEVAYAARQAIAGLPDDLKLPKYTSMFPETGPDADKIAKTGLYDWLSNRT
jgi:hypothetical protein